jgi:hypothetical protein
VQDFRLTELAAQQGRAVVVVVNKWDKVDKDVWTQETYTEDVRAQLRHVSWASVVCTNARRGEQMCRLLGLGPGCKLVVVTDDMLQAQDKINCDRQVGIAARTT